MGCGGFVGFVGGVGCVGCVGCVRFGVARFRHGPACSRFPVLLAHIREGRLWCQRSVAPALVAAEARRAYRSYPWALVVVPLTVIVGICAWKGLTLRETWRGFDEGPDGGDLGRGPAGLGWDV